MQFPLGVGQGKISKLLKKEGHGLIVTENSSRVFALVALRFTER